MTIDEAIDDLAEERDFEVGQDNQEMVDAIKLGIEALKRLQQLRLSPMQWFRGPLPGETEE